MTTDVRKEYVRVRKICRAYPETLERLSHGAPTFFAGGKKVFAMFVGDHHGSSRIAVWLPAPPDAQQGLVAKSPQTYFRPPYVGPSGWIGIDLPKIRDRALESHIEIAWLLVAPKRVIRARDEAQDE